MCWSSSGVNEAINQAIRVNVQDKPTIQYYNTTLTWLQRGANNIQNSVW